MGKPIKVNLILGVCFVLLLPTIVFSGLGVGVSAGKIQIDEPLKPGGIYDFPPLPVFNTGDEPSDYEVGIEYLEGAPQIRPERNWFTFSPAVFHLEPGKSQVVKIQVILPVKTKPGDYFAFLEGRPLIKTAGAGGARVGIAAAAKLYFTVAPANLWQAIVWRVSSFLTRHSPYSWIVLGVFGLLILVILFRRFFRFNINLSRR